MGKCSPKRGTSVCTGAQLLYNKSNAKQVYCTTGPTSTNNDYSGIPAITSASLANATTTRANVWQDYADTINLDSLL
jgi:hypothetical protein